MEILSFIIPFIILLTVVVFIHEYGHYYFAKKYGVGVTDFSIGFGKEIFGFNDKSGTRWKFCIIPLGGYVKFFGDRNVFSQAEQEELLKRYDKKDQQKLFVTKPLYQRSLIILAGPLANFILAILIFAFINMFSGKDFTPALINEVQKDSPAYSAGIKSGDLIISINEKEVNSILLKISDSAKSKTGNLLELSIEAAKVRATLGEISSALEEEFGRYKATVRTISGVYSNEIMQDQKYIKALSLAKKFESIVGRRPRIMVSKMGQDGHDRGAKVVATSFADIGFDVDIGPLFQTAKEVAKSAVENDVHIIGVSSLAAGHLTLVPELLRELKVLNREDIMIIIGGVIPKKDYDVLFDMGVAAVFGPGTIISEAAQEIIQIMINGFTKDEF